MNSPFSDTFTQAINQGGQFTVLVNARRRIPASGIVYKNDLIVTANHVVEREDELSVVLPDGKSIAARLVGRDPARDLVLLRLGQSGATPAQLASSIVQVG